MDPYRHFWQTDQKMFAPTLKGQDLLTGKRCYIDPGIASRSLDLFPCKGMDKLFQDYNRRPFRHANNYLYEGLCKRRTIQYLLLI